MTLPEYIQNRKAKPTKRSRRESSSSDSGNVIFDDSSSGDEQASDLENERVSCQEDYRQTYKKEL